MSKTIKHLLVVAAALSGLFVLACNSKIAECNKLIEKINASQPDMSKFANIGSDPSKIGAQLNDLAATCDKMKTDIQGVTLSDATLKGYQTQYLSDLDKMSTATKAEAAAFGKQDMNGMQAASKDVSAAADDTSKLTDNINKYCTGST
jgi:hypothetical protein